MAGLVSRVGFFSWVAFVSEGRGRGGCVMSGVFSFSKEGSGVF